MRLVKVSGVNLATTWCAPTANTCSGLVTSTYATDGTGTIDSVTDTLGNVTRYIYADANQYRMTGIRRPSSPSTNNVTIAYGPSGINGGVSQVVNAGGTWVYGQSEASGVRTATATNSDGLAANRVATIEIDTSRLLSMTDGINSVAYGYDDEGRVDEITTLGGIVTSLEFDARGNVLETTITSGSETIVTSADYPDTCANPVTCNLPDSTTDPRGFTTDYTYSSVHGGVLTVTLPDPDGGGSAVRPQVRNTYQTHAARYYVGVGNTDPGPPIYFQVETSSCATTSSCDGGADETISTTSYPSNSSPTNLLPTSSAIAAGNSAIVATTSYTWDTTGNLLTTDGPLSGSADTTRYRYDNGRRLIGMAGPDPDGGGALKHRARRITYNADSQAALVEVGTVNSQSDPDWANFATLESLDINYDAHGRVVQRSMIAASATQSVVQTSYDAISRPVCSALRMNPSEFGSLPASACTLDTQGAFGPDRITHQTYDTLSRPLVTTTGYGTAGAIAERTATYLSTGVGTGLLAALADGEGHLTSYAYDDFRRAYRTYYPNPSSSGSSSTDYEQYTYDDAGLVTQQRRRDAATIAYAYDNIGRLISITPSANGPTTNFTYDNFARVLTAAASSRTITYIYDQLSRVTSEAQPRGTMQYAWDLASQRTEMTFVSDDLDIQYVYNLVGEVTQIREEGATSGLGLLATYTYDNLGRRTAVSRGNGVTTDYAYDNASRLSELEHDLLSAGEDLTLGFDHNPAGGIIDRSSNNTLYDWTPASPSTTNYTANNLNQYASAGGVSQSSDSRGNLTTGSYSYDIFNRLVGGPSSATLAYDPLGRLYETATTGAATRFLYASDQIVAEFNSSNTLQRRYVPGPGVDEPILWYEGANTSDRRWLVADERGSVVAITDDDGDAITINSYDEYGLRGAGNAGRFQYTGQAWLSDVSLYHYRARAYSPTLGRFMQTDPIGFEGGMNLYAYVGNDPVNFIDPSGLQAQRPNGCASEDSPDCIVVVGPRRDPFHIYLRPIFFGTADWSAANQNWASDPINRPGRWVHEQISGEAAESLSWPDVVVVGRRPARARVSVPPLSWIWGLVRPSAAGMAIWALTPTTVADATCRSATNPGGYDCTIQESTLSPPYMTAIDPARDAASQRCYDRCYPILERWQRPGSDRNEREFHQCVRECMRDEGHDY